MEATRKDLKEEKAHIDIMVEVSYYTDTLNWLYLNVMCFRTSLKSTQRMRRAAR